MITADALQLTQTGKLDGQITPVTIKEQLQFLLPFAVEPVLSSNALLRTSEDEQHWTMLLHAFWQLLQEEDEE